MAGDKTTIKNRIVIEGEKEYRAAMRDITAAIREQRSALKAASAEYDNAEGEMRDAAAIGEALEQTYEAQGRALSEMQAHLAKIEDAYGKNSREATELRTRINNMRAEMAKSEGQMRDFRNRLDDVGSGTDEAAQGIRELSQAAGESQGEVRSFADELKALTGIDLPTLSIAAAVTAAGAGVQKGLELGNDQTRAENKMADYTGLTGAQLDAAVEAAKGVYTSGFGDDMQDAVTGTAQVNQNLKLTGDVLEDVTKKAFKLDEVFDMDVRESSRSASQMVTNFGVDAVKAYDIIAVAAQNGADKNGNLLDTINEYSPYFAEAGKSAEQFGAALSMAGQQGIYDLDKVGDGFKEFTIRVKDGSDTTKDALKSLGIEATDLPAKFAAGGETSSAAFDLVIAKLQAVEDPLKRNQLGIALFGTQWEDTGGKILDVYAAMSGGLESYAGAMDAMLERQDRDLGAQVEELGRKVEVNVGEAMQPVSEAAAGALNTLNDNIDAAGGSVLQGLGDTMSQAGTQLATDAATAYDEVTQGYTEWAVGFATAADAKLKEIWAALTQDSTKGADDTAQAAIDEIEAAQPDAQAAGETLGTDAVVGMESGFSGSYAAGESAANSVVGGLNSGIDSAYAAGWQTGSAYNRGYRNALNMHSPSRVMLEAADFTVSPLLDRFDDARSEIYARGRALGEALTGGYGDAFHRGVFAAGDAQSGGGGITREEMVDALTQALSQIALEFDGERVGRARGVATGVSREIISASQLSTKGLTASTRSW